MGICKDRTHTKTGEPYCRICGTTVWKKNDLDTEEENTHYKCAEERRVRHKRKEANPKFRTTKEEDEYAKGQADHWSFLVARW